MCGEKHLYGAKFETKGTSPPRVRGKAKIRHFSVSSRRITPAYAGKSLSLRRSGFCRWDHPRVCGEKVGPVGCVSGWLGSPPRMRGKAPSLAVLGACIGITPAYAGKSTDLQRPRAAQQDHPRVCGEKPQRKRSPSRFWGSPPRMRGKVAVCIAANASPGITPAYAGKSCVLRLKLLVLRDHPRVCGEKCGLYLILLGITGSPPRMRGKACPRWCSRAGHWDHPRVCGEKWAGLCTQRSSTGSPPRMRGKASPDNDNQAITRITPAYAGKRVAAQIFRNLDRDHPRVCGEKSISADSFSPGTGSPPRMRGKVNSPPQRLIKFGITPAYAGKSYTLLDLPAGERDHPRVCGEKALGHGHQPFVQGSPPRMRGKVYKAGVQDAGRGITPAYAGKSVQRNCPLVSW